MVCYEPVRKASDATPGLLPQAVEAALDAIPKDVEKRLRRGLRVELIEYGSFFARCRVALKCGIEKSHKSMGQLCH